MNFQMLHPADQLVMLMDRIYHHGMTTTSGGNLSVMDENGDIWITPSGIDKGTLTRADIICVHPDGSMDGIHTPSVELPFHQNIYRLRADIKGIVHAHPGLGGILPGPPHPQHPARAQRPPGVRGRGHGPLCRAG